MAESSEASVWIKFFTDAGIPSKSVRAYALAFSENCMQENMVQDLTKEYLNELGITLLGHIIAILRHAKTVHQKSLEVKRAEKAKTVLTVKTSSDDEEEDTAQVKKTGSAVTRIVDHYTRNSGTSPVKKTPKHKKLISGKTSNKEKNTRTVASLKRKAETFRLDELDDDDDEEEKLSLLQKAPVSVVRTPTVSSTNSAVVAKKPRRVLPEHEGGYTIKMPIGNTPRSRMILEKQKAIQEQRAKTVFDRLGSDSCVTSTTQSEGDVAFNVTFKDSSIIRNNTNKVSTNKIDVFNRLGNKVANTSILKPIEPQPLPYSGILKKVKSIPRKKVVIQKPNNRMTMRADEPKIPAKKRAMLNIKDGIVMKESKRSVFPGTEGILGKSQHKSALKTSVKSRLGLSSGSVIRSLSKASPESLRNEPLDFEVEGSHSVVTQKKVTFGTIEEKTIAPIFKFIPPDSGSIVLGTGIFKRN